MSLISQLGDQISYKFSYYFVIFDSNFTSKMQFGNEAMIKRKDENNKREKKEKKR